MKIAYRVDQVPAWGVGAFVPVAAKTPSSATAGAESNRYAAFGFLPTPSPQGFSGIAPGGPAYQSSFAIPPPGLPAAFSGVPQASKHEPYWQDCKGYGEATMKRDSDNVLPSPASNPTRVAVPAMNTPPYATVIATAWPRPFTSWPTWGTSRSA